MPRYRTLDEIFDEPDEFGLLKIQKRARSAANTPEARNADIIVQVNSFYETQGRLPDDNSLDLEEMKLGTIWRSIRTSPTATMMNADRNRLLGYGEPPVTNTSGLAEESAPEWEAPPTKERDWREDPLDDEIPESLDDIFTDDEDDVHEAVVKIRNVTPASERQSPDHRADLYICKDFEIFEKGFEEMQARLDAEERVATPIREGEEINVQEGDHFVHRGLLAYVAEKTELSRRSGKPDQRLRIIFSNGTENDPLMSSFRKALAADKTARLIHRPGFGPLDPEWAGDRLEITGTVYVARSLSDDPEIKQIRHFLHKVGVTSQNVKRRVADARNDPTFLMAPVEIVATYELHNLERSKVENLLHRFFEPSRPSKLTITDRFGKTINPREWFYVLPEHVSRAVQLIKNKSLHQYRYNPETQAIELFGKDSSENGI